MHRTAVPCHVRPPACRQKPFQPRGFDDRATGPYNGTAGGPGGCGVPSAAAGGDDVALTPQTHRRPGAGSRTPSRPVGAGIRRAASSDRNTTSCRPGPSTGYRRTSVSQNVPRYGNPGPGPSPAPRMRNGTRPTQVTPSRVSAGVPADSSAATRSGSTGQCRKVSCRRALHEYRPSHGARGGQRDRLDLHDAAYGHAACRGGAERAGTAVRLPAAARADGRRHLRTS